MSEEKCCFVKINENGKRLKCNKTATVDGFCALHCETSEEPLVSNEEDEVLGLEMYNVLEDEHYNNKNMETENEHTSEHLRKEVSYELSV
jgi:hypothetical protein